MKKRNLSLLVISIFCLSCSEEEQSPFDQKFEAKTLRVDYYHTGDATTETVEIDEMYSYENWAGSRVNLVSEFNYGSYFHRLYDEESGALIYSRSFDSYFKEYQTSTPAIEGEVKQFHESAIFPFPKVKAVFTLEKRQKDGEITQVFSQTIDPTNTSIAEAKKDPEVLVITSQKNGDAQVKADIAIVGEGYADEDSEKFVEDLKRFTKIFFQAEPCKSNRDKFNIYGVLKTSIDSGVDEPTHGIYKNTAVNATFNSMGSERYLLTEDNKALRDIAGHAPYDALYIMVNHDRYGGGGIYNFYCTFTSDNIFSEYLMVHEFGHSFFGLADEYYSSSTAYNDFYPAGYEPIEPNITALLDPQNVKWKNLLTEGIEMPTPWEKELYDEGDAEWQEKRIVLNNKIAQLQSENTPQDSVDRVKQEYDLMSKAASDASQEYLGNSKYAGMVGAFEGAGYSSTGLYRSSVNCIMFTKTNYFCPVCADAMQNTIDWYSK